MRDDILVLYRALVVAEAQNAALWLELSVHEWVDEGDHSFRCHSCGQRRERGHVWHCPVRRALSGQATGGLLAVLKAAADYHTTNAGFPDEKLRALVALGRAMDKMPWEYTQQLLDMPTP